MAINFHEGIGGSGKSYAALKDWIIPALQKGRHVFAYIEGLNHDQIADVAEIPRERAHVLLHQLTREQVPTIYKHVDNDSLVIIDELQNFWPATKERLSADMIQFITEHRHLGLDVLCMGQSLKDCHNMWRRRMASKIYFEKRTAIGKPNEYKETVFAPILNAKGDDVTWNPVTSTVHKLDPKFFGCYASHTDETENKETLVDKRAVIWSNKKIRYGIPAVLFLGVIALYYVWQLMHGGLVHAKPQEDKPALTSPIRPAAEQIKVKAEVLPPATIIQGKSPIDLAAPVIPDDPLDMVDNLSTNYRIRFGGYIQMGNLVQGFIEWRNDQFGLQERLSFDDLKGMGWQVLVNQTASLAYLQKYHRRYIVTPWPLPDSEGKLTTTQISLQKPISSGDGAEPHVDRDSRS